MPSSHSSSLKSKSSNSSSNGSARSATSTNTHSTAPTSYSDPRPLLKHYDTSPPRFGPLVAESATLDDVPDPRSSVETYASTINSSDDLADQPEYTLPEDRSRIYESDAIPCTPPDFARLFPTTRRILIQHDDSTSDGNMNLRLDAEAISTSGERLKMTLFHLRMKNMYERQFSLRRYCRESGREICSSKKKYAKPIPRSQHRKRPSFQRSWTTALTNMGLKLPRAPRRDDSGHESADGEGLEEDLRNFTLNSEVKATIPTNTIRLEFSNYAQVEVHRRREGQVKRYDFEYWGEPYTWQRELSYDDEELIYSYELTNLTSGQCIAYIMPDKLDYEQTLLEDSQGGWVPPSSMRITDRDVCEDLGDVIVATGLIVLTDDCIKRRWHSAHSARLNIPDECASDYIPPERIIDDVFPRHRMGTGRN